MASAIHFHGTDFFLDPSELDGNLLEDLKDCGGSGQQDSNVDYIMDNYHITGNEQDCQNYLKGYGAWEEDELQDHTENLRRLVWLTGADLCEQGEAHFSTY